MTIREVSEKEKNQFNAVAAHPLQSWEWGEFRQKTGLKVIRLGVFEGKKLKAGYQLTIHPLPKLPYTIIYLAKSSLPNEAAFQTLQKIGRTEKAIFIKLEPNINLPADQSPLNHYCQKGEDNFYHYTFQIDLTKSEEKLLTAMKSKTRYNIRVAQRHGVEIVQDKSKKAFETYLNLMWETTQRQGFYTHTKDYHRQLWETLSKTNIYHLFLAKYKNEILAAYIFFVFNGVLYYPYGASTREHREVMAPHLLFWEAMKFGKKSGCKIFDTWGSLGPNANPKDPWFGFHRFKAGFGGRLVESIGAYDLVINPQFYRLYNLANKLRWRFLRLKTHL
ncbi:peptidoglycan bridge formation protein FemAB [Candidatus Shapirobacteria bacterium CG09_land_8_20_14_0_10_39_12]|uniref:Peptidoglycan bridge formation protein FemAB n=2 Tax=Candidatus Shapironibacteriota TaxID=1752721 RepID=A0A2M8L539_9BACT|nr:MAG: peptidoglycan bridge formation protein FemAB [Candidatus Shapirobacteria bacterium CG09_land_8_20_14_0_10_39_12]PJE68951.1 MAG: peptidoglycan bridge formation protein FemAB [Candidatus Shapirobacteria bacterium CG10_big_fil_rev_8_21_14_0_10_38_14]